jgi:hypothetical protein
MRDLEARGTFGIHVWGDWHSVIGVINDIRRTNGSEDPGTEALYDSALEQKPMDEDDADYFRYQFKDNRADNLVGLWSRFRKAHLEAEFFCHVASDSGVETQAATGTGYRSKPVPFFMADVDSQKISLKMQQAMTEAVNLLNAAR